MTSPGGSAPADWYADPSDPSQLRYFDGATWTTHTAPNRQQHPAPPLTTGFFTLATWLQGTLGAIIVCQMAYIATSLWNAHTLAGMAAQPATASHAAASRVDALILIGYIGDIASYLLCGVLFIIWLFQAARSDRVPSAALRRGPGWAIGGWFVPIGSLFLPFQTVTDVRRGAGMTLRDCAVPPSAGGLIGWWWASFVWLNLVRFVPTLSIDDTITEPAKLFRNMRTVEILTAVTGGFTIISAVLALLVVRSITNLLRN